MWQSLENSIKSIDPDAGDIFDWDDFFEDLNQILQVL
jgi:hypothetical protein